MVQTLSFNQIEKFFHLPLLQAAIELKLDLAELKNEMKRLNILRWPYCYKRKVKEEQKKPEQFISFSLKDYKVIQSFPKKIEKKEKKSIHKVKIENLLN